MAEREIPVGSPEDNGPFHEPYETPSSGDSPWLVAVFFAIIFVGAVLA